MQWIARKKIPILAYLIFFLPALVIPAFVHDMKLMRGYVCLAWLFATPIAAWIGCLSHRRTLQFYLGIASLVLNVEIIWYLAYISLMQANLEREKVAELYMPIVLLASMVLVPAGFFLTYAGSRDRPEDGSVKS